MNGYRQWSSLVVHITNPKKEFISAFYETMTLSVNLLKPLFLFVSVQKTQDSEENVK
jgi:hypothetical protein